MPEKKSSHSTNKTISAKHNQWWDEFRKAEQRKAKLLDDATGSKLAAFLELIITGKPSLQNFRYPGTVTPESDRIALKRIADAGNAGTRTPEDLEELRELFKLRRQRELDAVAADPFVRVRYAAVFVAFINEMLAPFMPEKSPPTDQERLRWENDVPEMIQVFRSVKIHELEKAAKDIFPDFARYGQDASPLIAFMRESKKSKGGRSDVGAVEVALDNLQLHQVEIMTAPQAATGNDCTLTVTKAAEISGISKSRISEACDSGKLRSNGKSGSSRRISASGFTEWQVSRTMPDAQESTEAVERKFGGR